MMIYYVDIAFSRHPAKSTKLGNEEDAISHTDRRSHEYQRKTSDSIWCSLDSGGTTLATTLCVRNSLSGATIGKRNSTSKVAKIHRDAFRQWLPRSRLKFHFENRNIESLSRLQLSKYRNVWSRFGIVPEHFPRLTWNECTYK